MPTIAIGSDLETTREEMLRRRQIFEKIPGFGEYLNSMSDGSFHTLADIIVPRVVETEDVLSKMGASQESCWILVSCEVCVDTGDRKKTVTATELIGLFEFIPIPDIHLRSLATRTVLKGGEIFQIDFLALCTAIKNNPDILLPFYAMMQSNLYSRAYRAVTRILHNSHG